MKIGLALGGGGARGIAHLGVWQRLQELGIPIHCVAGTSIGSIAGAVIVAGISAIALGAIILAAVFIIVKKTKKTDNEPEPSPTTQPSVTKESESEDPAEEKMTADDANK